jgi:GTP-binding protein EngB required for normal cell division
MEKQRYVVFLGKVGHGKTRLMNNLTLSTYASTAAASSCTRSMQLGRIPESTVTIVDTPGFYSSDEVKSHIDEQIKALEMPNSGIYIIVRFGDPSEMAEVANRMMDFTGEEDVRVICTHVDTVERDDGFDGDQVAMELSSLLDVPKEYIALVGKNTDVVAIRQFILDTMHKPRAIKVAEEQRSFVASLSVGSRKFNQDIEGLPRILSEVSNAIDVVDKRIIGYLKGFARTVLIRNVQDRFEEGCNALENGAKELLPGEQNVVLSKLDKIKKTYLGPFLEKHKPSCGVEAGGYGSNPGYNRSFDDRWETKHSRKKCRHNRRGRTGHDSGEYAYEHGRNQNRSSNRGSNDNDTARPSQLQIDATKELESALCSFLMIRLGVRNEHERALPPTTLKKSSLPDADVVRSPSGKGEGLTLTATSSLDVTYGSSPTHEDDPKCRDLIVDTAGGVSCSVNEHEPTTTASGATTYKAENACSNVTTRCHEECYTGPSNIEDVFAGTSSCDPDPHFELCSGRQLPLQSWAGGHPLDPEAAAQHYDATNQSSFRAVECTNMRHKELGSRCERHKELGSRCDLKESERQAAPTTHGNATAPRLSSDGLPPLQSQEGHPFNQKAALRHYDATNQSLFRAVECTNMRQKSFSSRWDLKESERQADPTTHDNATAARLSSDEPSPLQSLVGHTFNQEAQDRHYGATNQSSVQAVQCANTSHSMFASHHAFKVSKRQAEATTHDNFAASRLSSNACQTLQSQAGHTFNQEVEAWQYDATNQSSVLAVECTNRSQTAVGSHNAFLVSKSKAEPTPHGNATASRLSSDGPPPLQSQGGHPFNQKAAAWHHDATNQSSFRAVECTNTRHKELHSRCDLNESERHADPTTHGNATAARLLSDEPALLQSLAGHTFNREAQDRHYDATNQSSVQAVQSANMSHSMFASHHAFQVSKRQAEATTRDNFAASRLSSNARQTLQSQAGHAFNQEVEARQYDATNQSSVLAVECTNRSQTAVGSYCAFLESERQVESRTHDNTTAMQLAEDVDSAQPVLHDMRFLERSTFSVVVSQGSQLDADVEMELI